MSRRVLLLLVPMLASGCYQNHQIPAAPVTDPVMAFPRLDAGPAPPTSRLAASDCVTGIEVTSVEDGDRRCATQFGEGWRWLEFHEQGGWSVALPWLRGAELPVGSRGWVHISDQDAECFSSDYGMTWAPSSRGATCNLLDGLEGPEFRPQPDYDKCNAYTGDTPCAYCRPLLCVR
ncbi:MAG: hypothetical protein R3B82_02700 [Sandaracinaceae bacterium]